MSHNIWSSDLYPIDVKWHQKFIKNLQKKFKSTLSWPPTIKSRHIWSTRQHLRHSMTYKTININVKQCVYIYICIYFIYICKTCIARSSFCLIAAQLYRSEKVTMLMEQNGFSTSEYQSHLKLEDQVVQKRGQSAENSYYLWVAFQRVAENNLPCDIYQKFCANTWVSKI